MIDRNHTLPIKRQAELLSIGRSTVYYRPRPVSEADLQAIAFMEGRTVHGLHSEDAKMATDLLNARFEGKVDMPDEAVAVYVERVCRNIPM